MRSGVTGACGPSRKRPTTRAAGAAASGRRLVVAQWLRDLRGAPRSAIVAEAAALIAPAALRDQPAPRPAVAATLRISSELNAEWLTIRATLLRRPQMHDGPEGAHHGRHRHRVHPCR